MAGDYSDLFPWPFDRDRWFPLFMHIPTPPSYSMNCSSPAPIATSCCATSCNETTLCESADGPPLFACFLTAAEALEKTIAELRLKVNPVLKPAPNVAGAAAPAPPASDMRVVSIRLFWHLDELRSLIKQIDL